jgi:hypothetical protein
MAIEVNGNPDFGGAPTIGDGGPLAVSSRFLGRIVMTRLRIFAALLSVGILTLTGNACAADGKTTVWRYNGHGSELPFPRSERAQAVWASGRCWRECGSYCAWGMAGCLEQDSQGLCLKLTDRCDRYCQRECRTGAGPFVPFELPWD